jgi:hypothetical protein
MKKFIVYLTEYNGTLLPKFYIGSTTREKFLSGKYFGSVRSKKWSKIFSDEIKNNSDLFSIKCLSCHDDRKLALEEELRLQTLKDVVNSDEYFNESLASPDGFFGRDVSGENNPFFGKAHSDEFRSRQSESKKGKETWMKGKTHSAESKIKNSESHKGKPVWNSGKKNVYSEETLEKIRKAQQARRLREKLQKQNIV